jgi:hypothetical protein
MSLARFSLFPLEIVVRFCYTDGNDYNYLNRAGGRIAVSSDHSGQPLGSRRKRLVGDSGDFQKIIFWNYSYIQENRWQQDWKPRSQHETII